ncbi:MAG TPA: hypothetical protein VGI72_03395 [Gaiellales bacterium]
MGASAVNGSAKNAAPTSPRIRSSAALGGMGSRYGRRAVSASYTSAQASTRLIAGIFSPARPRW